MTTPAAQSSTHAAGALPMAGRTALVTGASSGIGWSLSLAIAAAGAKVAVAARRTDRLRELVDEIRAKGGTAVAVEMDVANEASIIRAYDAAESAIGPIDTVVANAGINSEGFAVDLPADEFDALMSVNLRGVFLSAREGGKRMIKRGAPPQGGRVLLVASIGGLRPLPGLVAYSVSKAGVVMMGKSLALEWARYQINVNVLCPGYIETDINADWFKTPAGEKQIKSFPRRRLMALSDLSEGAIYLLSNAARGTTGAVIAIDDAQSI